MRIRIHLALAASVLTCALAAAGGAGVAQAAIAQQTYVAVDAVPGTADAGKTSTTDPDTNTATGTGSTATPLGTTSAFAPIASAETSGPTPSILTGLNQPGLGASSGVYPPDQFGAIGPEHYVQGVNNYGMAVYRRSDLAQVAGPVPLASFAAAPAGHEVYDTQVMWDVQTSRWYYSFTYKRWLNNVRTSGILYGWSKTSDPTDLAHGWCQMKIDTGANFEDRPKLGDTATHLILATNADPISGAGDYTHVWTMPKPANGDTTCPTTQTGIKAFGSESAPLRSSDGDIPMTGIAAMDNDGSATGWVVAAEDHTTTTNQLMLWRVTAAGDLVAEGLIPVSPMSDPPGAPQPSPYSTLDPVDRRLNSAISDRDPDVGATAIWTSQTIADPSGTGRSIVRWYELVPGACAPVTANICQAAARRQQGEVKDPSNWLFNAAMAPTDTGNEAVLHYDSASTTQLTQVRARSRVSNTPLGALGNEITIDTSDAADDDETCHDTRPHCRWGDFSAATTDPNDPHAVWGSNQAIGPKSTNNPYWKTRNFALHATPSSALVHSGTGAVDASPGGDGDGVIEPGESIDLTETVRNAGGAGATGISGALTSASSGVSIVNGSSPYPDIAPSGTGSNSTPFRAGISSAVTCGTPLSMTVTLTTAQGRYRVPISLPTGAVGAPQSTSATDVPKTIPDNSATGVSSSISIPTAGRLADVNVSISKITHTWDGDLKIELTGPDGTTVVLADRPGGGNNSGDNFVNTVLDDEAGTSLSSGVPPYTGTFRPPGQLSAFDGKQAQGTWTLKVADLAAGDTGYLEGWGTRLSAASCNVASNTPPAAGFTSTPNPALTSQTITFASTSSDPDGSVASQAWDLDNDGAFDDGSSTSASRSFATAGAYTVRLKVTDDKGASSIATNTVTVQNRPPVASFTASPSPALTNQAVTFTDTSTDPDGTIAGWAWDLDNDGAFDDGTSSTASRTFTTPGSYTVRLRATDDLGATSISTRTVTVDNRPPVASFTAAPSAPTTNQSVTFTSTSTDADGTIASQAWDLDNDGAFDDGTAASASRSFATPGTYTVRLQVTDDRGSTATSSQSVTVGNQPPVAAFSSSPAAPATADTVTFTSSSSDPDGSVASQAWDLDNDGAFDDGTAATASSTFATAGTYTVRLQVTDDKGATGVTSRTVTVSNRAPTASFSVSPAAPLTQQAVTLTSTSTDADGTIASQAWDLDNDGAFDDGTAATASRQFSKAGSYTVRLQVTDNSGATATASRTVTVANRTPTASFTYTPSAPKSGETVTFTSSSADLDGTIASQAWDLDNDGAFDDGTGTTASRSWPKGGKNTVRLQVTDDNGATAIASQVVSVSNRPPGASFSSTPTTAATSDPVTFTSAATDPDGTITAQAWDLDGDGQYDDATGSTATHAYAQDGTYTVGLLVTDDQGATATTEHTIAVANRPPVANFTISPNPTSSGQTVTFASTSTDSDGSVTAHAWDLDNDGAFDDGTAATASRSFSTPGTYTVRLRATDDDGATNVKTGTVTIDNQAPTARFSYSPAAPASGQDVTFTSASTDPDGPLASQAWDLDNDGAFDDGTATTATRSFAKAGDHTVRLRVLDPQGGSSTATQVVTVAGRAPTAAFTVDPQTVETGQPSHFDAAASADPDGTIERYDWDLDGDGSFETSTAKDPVTSRFYDKPGNVIVGLRVTDDDGQTAVTQRTVTVTEAPPFADGPNVPPPDAGPLPGAGPEPGTTPDPAEPPKPSAGAAPRGSLRVTSNSLAGSLRHGVALRFSSSAAATAKFKVTIRGKRAGAATKLVGAGRASTRVKLSKKLRAALSGRVPAKVTMTLIGADGLSRTYTAHAVLR